MAKSTDDPIAFRVFNEIGIIAQLSRHQFEGVIPGGLKLSQFMVLNHLVRVGDDWPPARLAAAFQVTKGAMTNTINRLEARGLIQVTPDPEDGRGKRVAITKAGRATRKECIENLAPLLGDLLTEFPATELGKILPVLERLRAYLDDHRSGHRTKTNAKN
jgi:DNA-binding MarR family transcriptional regulator